MPAGVSKPPPQALRKPVVKVSALCQARQAMQPSFLSIASHIAEEAIPRRVAAILFRVLPRGHHISFFFESQACLLHAPPSEKVPLPRSWKRAGKEHIFGTSVHGWLRVDTPEILALAGSRVEISAPARKPEFRAPNLKTGTRILQSKADKHFIDRKVSPLQSHLLQVRRAEGRSGRSV